MSGMKKLLRGVLPPDLPEFARDVRDILVYAAGKLVPDRKLLALSLLLKGAAFLLGLLIVYITKLTIDEGILAGDLRAFILYTGLGLASFLSAKTLTHVSDSIQEKERTRFSMDVNRDMAARFFDMDYLSFRSLSSSENSFLLQYDQDSMENLVFTELAFIASALKIPAYLAMGFLVSPVLTLLVLAALPPVAAHTLRAAKNRKTFRGRELYLSRKHHAAVHDAFLNFKLIKSMGKEGWAGDNIVRTFRRKAAGALKAGLFSLKMRTLSGVMSRGATAAYWALGGYLVIRRGLSFGSFSAVSIYAGMVLSESVNIGMFLEGLYSERASIKRCAAFARDMVSSARDGGGGMRFAVPVHTGIVFDDVSFAYPGRAPVIERACFSVPGKSWCWIKGVSGAGKTTLLGLLLGLFAPMAGKITVGGEDLGRIDRERFFRRVSAVHQDPYLFNDTVINNVLMGDTSRGRELERALRVSGTDRLVSSLPLGYNTRVGEYGSALSGGQKQRIAIARALFREPDLLVLDEATSFLDAGSENSIFERIKRHFPGMTVVFVTHRDTVSAYADMTLVLRGGKVFSEEYCGYDGKGAGKGA